MAVSWCCCCCKRTEWYKFRARRHEAHNEVFERLSNEIDIFNFVTASRNLRLLTHTVLRTNQRQLVQYFKQYHIDYKSLKVKESKTTKVEKLTEHFDPAFDPIDKRILYEITGRKGPADHFSDESSDNQSELSRS